MKTPEERGPRADWITRHRAIRFGTNMDAFRAALARVGYEAADSTVRGWEAGANAKPAAWIALAKLFGEEPPEPHQPATLDDLVAAINDLVAEMRQERGANAAALRGVERALEVVATTRMPVGS